MLAIEYSFSHNLLISQSPDCILFVSALYCTLKTYPFLNCLNVLYPAGVWFACQLLLPPGFYLLSLWWLLHVAFASFAVALT